MTFVVFLQLWRYCKEALRLRQFYLLNTPKGAESHTIMCTDIPGVAFGTIPQRLDGTLLKMVPKSVKSKAFAQVEALGETAAAVADAPVDADVAASNAEAAGDISSLATQVDAKTGRWEMPDRWNEAVTAIKAKGGSPKDGQNVEAMVADEFQKVYKDDFKQVGGQTRKEHAQCSTPLLACIEYPI